MANYFLIKYKDNEGGFQTIIDKERDSVGIESLIRDMNEELRKFNGVVYPIFAIEEISERQFCYFKKKGYYSIGVE